MGFSSLVLRPFSLLSLFIVASSSEAIAYECTPVTNANPPLTQAWVDRCIPYFIGNTGEMFDGDDRRQLVDQCFRVWSSVACTDLVFMDFGRTDQMPGFNPSAPSSNRNVILSIENQNDLDRHFQYSDLLAITLTSFSTSTGEIFDADIALNGVRYPYDDVQDSGSCSSSNPKPYDLRNTLIHEIGHVIGFDHTTDQNSTMYPSATPCETSKRDLDTDDEFGLCTVYASGQPTRTCQGPSDYDEGGGDPSQFRNQCERLLGQDGSDCSCRAATHRRSSPVILLVFCGLLFWRRISGR